MIFLHLTVICAPEVAHISGVSLVETPCDREVTLAAGSQPRRYLHHGNGQSALILLFVDFLDLRE